MYLPSYTTEELLGLNVTRLCLPWSKPTGGKCSKLSLLTAGTMLPHTFVVATALLSNRIEYAISAALH